MSFLVLRVQKIFLKLDAPNRPTNPSKKKDYYSVKKNTNPSYKPEHTYVQVPS